MTNAFQTLLNLFFFACLAVAKGYYIACNSDKCIANQNLSELHDTIRQIHFRCINPVNINNRKHIFACFTSIFSIRKTIFNIWQCDNYDFTRMDGWYNSISNDPALCTITSIPILHEYDIALQEHLSKTDIYVKKFNLQDITKKDILGLIQSQAISLNAFAIVQYKEQLENVPYRRCRAVRVGKTFRQKCRNVDALYITVSFYILY